ncbi:ATP synthase F0 subcomplex A subunit [Acetitomaculum ruminis DSM 5522]|uniref:ATP synthase subunit a n=2 Tax=Acetitomaculum ruminis TaxID=2382 RepID=A0A1I0YSY4_9FIRM|nr:F0F1 ATP synthase subunit A [Acetitomaculum ruminis]SFB15926.1 ATP synthase F0 subcomplex A subunit [Acetitomaculum ruminis DSM 5522]
MIGANLSTGSVGLGHVVASDVQSSFMIKGVFSYELFGQKLYITTTGVSVFIVMSILVIFALVVNAKMKKADEIPGTFQCIVEMAVEALDNMVSSNIGAKHYKKYVNYIGTIFIFILLSNVSGLLGLRPPTADYGVTFPLGVMTFCIIHFVDFKYNKPSGVIKSLMEPWPFWLPINLVGDFAVPISMSLRLFANVLSGTIIMALIYGLLNMVAYAWPAFLHMYFDLFSGAIQTYVFCMLTMAYVSEKLGEN